MRNVFVVLLAFAVSAVVAVSCVSLFRTCNSAQARQGAVQLDELRTRPDEWKPMPAYELDDVWPF